MPGVSGEMEDGGAEEGKGRGCRLPKSTLSLRRERRLPAPSTCHKKQEDGAGINRLIDQASGLAAGDRNRV